MDEIVKTVANIMNYMEQDTRGVQVGCYTLALAGLTIAVRKVRPFSKFVKPSDIPDHFIKEKRELSGIVKGINPSGPLLVVQHKPLLPLPRNPEGNLPVKISGVKVSSLGVSWLQSITNGKEILFTPISKEKNFLQCEVFLPFMTINKKNIPQREMLNIGSSLVKVGFGEIEVDNHLLKNPNFQSCYNRLQAAESYALRKKLGIKYYLKPTKLILEAILRKFNISVTKPTKKIVGNLPYMVKT